MGIVIGLLVIGFFVFMIIYTSSKKNQWRKSFIEKYGGLNFMKSGTLVSGHPDVDERVERSVLILKDGVINIFRSFDDLYNIEVKEVGTIDTSNVIDVFVEDQSTIERRITATRVLLVGVFALAWKKKKKNELSYLTIKWKDGRFEHETVFEFESKDSLTQANKLRNDLIKFLR